MWSHIFIALISFSPKAQFQSRLRNVFNWMFPLLSNFFLIYTHHFAVDETLPMMHFPLFPFRWLEAGRPYPVSCCHCSPSWWLRAGHRRRRRGWRPFRCPLRRTRVSSLPSVRSPTRPVCPSLWKSSENWLKNSKQCSVVEHTQNDTPFKIVHLKVPITHYSRLLLPEGFKSATHIHFSSLSKLICLDIITVFH